MAHHLSDNIYTKGFTPREYQVEVLHNVKEHNIIVRSGNSTTKTFIALKLIQEFANNIRRSYTNGGKRTLFVAGSLSSVVQNAITIRHLSDLKVGEYCATSKPLDIINHQVLVMTSDVCWFHINNGNLKLADINLLIADECHQAIRAHPLQQIMEVFGQIPLPRPHVLGLTTLLVPVPGGANPGRLEAEIQRLESVFHCRAETASDIVSVLRYCAKPKEMVVECADYPSTELSNIIEEQILLIVEFLDDHRYNPSEIYYEESLKDFIKIPNPKKVPYNLLKNFWQILKTMGPWCADKAALALLIQIEKLKVKTQYKRHVLLLCLVSSLLIKIRAICEDALQEFKEKERILKFSSPKILRLIEIIRQFKPKSQPPDIQDNIETESNTSINCNQETFNSKSAEELSSENHDSISSMISSSDEVSSNMFKESGNDNDSCYAHDRDNNVASDSKKDESNGAEGEDYVSVCDEKLNEPVKINSVLQDNLNSDNLLNNVNYNDNNSSLNRQEHCNKMNDNVSKNNIENDFKSSDSLDEFKSNFNSCNDNLIKNCEISNNASKYTKDSRTSVYSDVMSKPSIDNISTELSLVLMDSTNNVQNIELSDNIRCSCPPNNGMPKITSGEECAMRGERWQGRGQGWRLQKRVHPLNNCKGKDNSLQDSENLCAIIFVKNRFTAKILFYLLNELRKFDPDFEFLCPQYIVEKTADPATESHKAEKELKRQEKVLERFRMGECNMLVATSVLEEGIDLPKCNLIIRYDIPSNYRSYVHSKGRACGQDSHYLLMVEESQVEGFVADLAQFMEIEKMLLARCTNREPSDEEEIEADLFTNCVIPYTPVPGKPTNVNMANAIALVNRYCAKLPSDDFTHLTPLWWIKEVSFNGSIHFVCTVRLPINSSVKQDIVGHPMPTRALARRIVALEVCRVLHMTNELDDQLQPTGKETFTALETAVEEEPDSEDVECISAGPWDTLEPRPGTTKRRQYYYKRIASSLSGCRPTPGKAAKLYQLKMVLTCPLPEEQNTRGWKIHPPEDAPKGFGILTLKDIPKICPFPIFTRSGEVRVSLELKGEELFLNERQLDTIAAFLHYTFTNVLRLQKHLTLFHPNASENSLLVVPTKKTDSGSVDVDWDFLELIYLHKDDMLQIIPGEVRATFTFESLKFHDTVVMPCYRNQDQPQYFYVVDICDHLNPKSSFPRNIYKTFEEYYLKKYGIQVQNTQQPLLEVNPTSTRLNFLTPRYVSHKGVAFPTTSEEKKRAKRENLEQKEILVPELCMIHPFPASLWRQAVCLPSILYRINALLLADEIRTTVAKEIALGLLQLPTDFEWRPLDFGWSPADVLRKSREENENKITALKAKNIPNIIELDDNNVEVKNEEDTNTTDLKDENLVIADEEEDSTWMEIGTRSNDMAGLEDFFDPDSGGSPNGALVCNGSPTSWAVGRNHGQELCLYDSDLGSDSSSDLDDDFSIQSEDSRTEMGRGLYSILSDYLAKAVDDESDTPSKESDWQWKEDGIILEKEVERETQRFNEATEKHKKHIMSSGIVVFHESPFIINHETSKSAIETSHEEHKLDFSLVGYAIPDELKLALKDNNMSQPSQVIAVNIDSSDSSDDEEDFEYPLFSFDEQSDLIGHPGPSPSIILQALTMSSAIDGINLGRLATIGDSFMKYAITTYLYCTYEGVREGKLSYLRSKLVSNLNLYRLGKRKVFGESMIATNFEPRNNWLPPCYLVPRKLEPALIEAGLPACQSNQADMSGLRDLSRDEINGILKERGEQLAGDLEEFDELPYNLITQQSIPDKSIADCVEALIGAYLIDCGPRGALLFLSWLGIRVLPYEEMTLEHDSNPKRQPGRLQPGENSTQICYGYLKPPRSPLMRHVPDADKQLNLLLNGFDVFEKKLKYRFKDRSYLLQAMTHATYSPNRLTDCYQRLEFLGDAVLDYLITRHFYEDKQQHCPGALTDLRSALVNNTIFAVLAVRHGFHKFLRHLSPGLAEVVEQYVCIQEENSHAINEEYYLTGVEECEEAEDVEVPKVLGDVFESVAGAVFLDSQMSLDAVWKVYYRMMKSEIEKFSTNVPKSPLRELLEMESHTAKIGKPEKLADGRHVRVTVEVIGIGVFKGIGRNYRIAKCNAAKCALKKLKKCRLLAQKMNPGQR